MNNFESEDEVDIWLDARIQMPKHGFLVDVGCANPRQYSQSHWLRARGWNWLAIDGTPEYAPAWANQENGIFINAVVLDGQPIRFINERTNSLVSRVHPEGDLIQTQKLSSILLGHGVGRIDFMCIDVENSEPVVLKDIFEMSYFPSILVVEYNSQHAGRNPETIMLPIRAGYRLIHMTNSNAVFVLQK